jgi:hypothetical protein
MSKQTKYFRSATISTDDIDVNNRTCRVVFSSTAPVPQSYGMEVLSHDAADVDMSRLVSGSSPVLLEHNMSEQIGVIEEAVIDGQVGRAILRFSTNPKASEIFSDIVAGIRQNISVGYFIGDRSLVDGTVTPPVYKIKWSPFEISVVSVPADTNAGVGRSLDTETEAEDKDEDELSEMNMKSCKTKSIDPDMDEDDDSADSLDDEDEEDDKQERSINKNNYKETNMSTETQTTTDFAAVERTRAVEISEIATRHNVQALGNEFIANGKTAAEFRAAVLDTLGARAQTVQSSAVIGLTAKETQAFNFGKAVRGLVSGDWSDAEFEREATRAAAKAAGKIADGSSIVLPMEYMTRAAMTVGGSNNGNDLVATTLLPGSFLDALFNKSIAAKLGVSYLTGLVGNVEIPKFTSKAAAYEVAEGVDITQSSPATGRVHLAPRQIGTLVEYTRSMALQSTPYIEGILRAHIINAMNQKIDQLVFDAILADSSVAWQSLGTDGGAPTWAKLVSSIAALESANVPLDNAKWAINPLVAAKLKTTLKDTNYAGIYLMSDDAKVAGYASESSNNVPHNLTKGTGTALGAAVFGDYSFVNVGQWGSLELALDTSQRFASGGYLLRAMIDLDVAITRDEAFSGFKDIVVA